MRDLRVVIVEDDPSLRRLLRLTLELAGGFEVVGDAADGGAGLALVDEHRPDVVVLDLGLPVLDGLSIVRAVARRRPEVRIVVFTGGSEPGERARVLAAGASEVVGKGCAVKSLVRTIEAVGAACA